MITDQPVGNRASWARITPGAQSSSRRAGSAATARDRWHTGPDPARRLGLFAGHGFHGTSIRDTAAGAGRGAYAAGITWGGNRKPAKTGAVGRVVSEPVSAISDRPT
jgi:hypothetical protein